MADGTFGESLCSVFLLLTELTGWYTLQIRLSSGLAWSLASDLNDTNLALYPYVPEGRTIPFIEYLWRQGKLDEPLFSLTLFDQSQSPDSDYHIGPNGETQGSTLEGGQLTIGGIEEDLIEPNSITYSPVLSLDPDNSELPGIWEVTVEGVRSYGQAQDARFAMRIDLATTDSILPYEVFWNILSR